MKNHLSMNRRSWLKKSLLTTTGAIAAPYLGFSNRNYTHLKFDQYGNIVHGSNFKEFTLGDKVNYPVLQAKLNANENPYGPSPMALSAFNSSVSQSNRYAWDELFELTEEIAEFEGVQPENIVLGPGSSDLLEKTAICYFMDGGNIISADPAYMSLIKVAQEAGAEWKSVPLKEDWSHDLEAMKKAVDSDTKLIYICNPNNPTGTITDSKELVNFCREMSKKTTVFIDEAYLWFLEDGAKQSMVSLVNEGCDVIIARTFSKIHGLAGLRIGYAVANTKSIEKIQRITRAGMGISLPSVYAAKSALKDVAFIEKSRSLNFKARAYTYGTLIDAGFNPVESHTSFMIFPIDMEGKEFLNRMRMNSVAVRAFEFMDNIWCRVSIGTLSEMELFLKSVKDVLTKKA